MVKGKTGMKIRANENSGMTIQTRYVISKYLKMTGTPGKIFLQFLTCLITLCFPTINGTANSGCKSVRTYPLTYPTLMYVIVTDLTSKSFQQRCFWMVISSPEKI